MWEHFVGRCATRVDRERRARDEILGRAKCRDKFIMNVNAK